MLLLFQRNSIFRTYLKHQGHLPITLEDTSHSENAPTDNSQTSSCLPWIRVLQEMYQGFCKNSKTIDPPTQQQVKFEWTPAHHEAFLKLKTSIILLCNIKLM